MNVKNIYYGTYMWVLHIENGLMKFIIENDVSIICLTCGYCFKSF
jgi:hypothetical protein